MAQQVSQKLTLLNARLLHLAGEMRVEACQEGAQSDKDAAAGPGQPLVELSTACEFFNITEAAAMDEETQSDLFDGRCRVQHAHQF